MIPTLPDLSRPALELAPALLGVRLVRVDEAGVRRVGTIVETEAYPGGADLASHTSGGRRTPRTESMYLEGGHAYVYRIYGIHDCVNVVSGRSGSGEAVLLRSIRPESGIEAMREDRPGIVDRDLARGPGRLCKALAIGRDLDRIRFGSGPMSLEAGTAFPPAEVVAAPRVGIDRAGEWAARPWRFLAGDPVWWSVRPRRDAVLDLDPGRSG